MYVKLESAFVPPKVVTLISPDNPGPTVTVICVGESTVNVSTGTPPIVTAVVPFKFSPVITTVSP